MGEASRNQRRREERRGRSRDRELALCLEDDVPRSTRAERVPSYSQLDGIVLSDILESKTKKSSHEAQPA